MKAFNTILDALAGIFFNSPSGLFGALLTLVVAVFKIVWRRRFLRRSAVGALTAGFLIVASGVPGCIRGFRADPERLIAPPERAHITDRAGHLYTHFGAAQINVRYEVLPQHLIDAFRAREDKRFFEHPGVDVIGVGRAIIKNSVRLKIASGASTIDQQLAEHVFQTNGPGLWNRWQAKWTEWIIALRANHVLKKKLGSKMAVKKRIFEAYLNKIEFNHGVRGLGNAAKFNFNKSVGELTIGEAAILAGLVRAPSSNDPYRRPQTAREARDAVITRMLANEWITPKQAKEAKFYVVPNPKAPKPRHNGYLPAAVSKEIDRLVRAKEAPAELLGDKSLHDSLEVEIGVDLSAQEIVEREVAEMCARFNGRSLKRDPLLGAAVLVENATGDLLALVSGQAWHRNQYDLALSAKRQMASTEKIFLWGEYLERGGRIDDVISNTPLTRTEIRHFGEWSPSNSSSLRLGEWPAWKGLAFSDNYIAARLGLRLGMPYIRSTLRRAGLISNATADKLGWSAILGSAEVSPVGLAAASASVPRGGTVPETRLVRKIKLHDDTVFKAHSKSTALFSSNTCKQLHRGLEAAMTEGTGAKAARGIRPKVPLAGKTGTTDNGRDAWFVGYTREVTLVVWFGRDSNRPISSDASGGNVAAPTAVNIFDALDRLYRLTAPTF